MRRRACLILVGSLLLLTGCNRTAVPALDREFDIAVRAGLGQLSEYEKECLLKEDHSILLLDAASQDEFLGLMLLRFAALRGGEFSEEARRETSAVLQRSEIGFVDVELLSASSILE